MRRGEAKPLEAEVSRSLSLLRPTQAQVTGRGAKQLGEWCVSDTARGVRGPGSPPGFVIVPTGKSLSLSEAQFPLLQDKQAARRVRGAFLPCSCHGSPSKATAAARASGTGQGRAATRLVSSCQPAALFGAEAHAVNNLKAPAHGG